MNIKRLLSRPEKDYLFQQVDDHYSLPVTRKNWSETIVGVFNSSSFRVDSSSLSIKKSPVSFISVNKSQSIYRTTHQNYYLGVSASYPGLPVHTFKEASMNSNLAPAGKKAGGWENQHYALNFHFSPDCTIMNNGIYLPSCFRANGSTRSGSKTNIGYYPSASAGRVATRDDI